MKKFTLVAAAVVAAVAAQAQYTVNPSTEEVLKGGVSSVDYLVLSEGAIADFTKAGAKVTYVGPSAEDGRNLWYWSGFTAGDESFPRVDMEEGGYISVEVTPTEGWSGAGINIAKDNGVNFSNFDDNTMFHMAYMTPSGNGPASIAVILLDNGAPTDGSTPSQPVKFALGDAFNDNGAIFPSVGPKITDDWQGIEISLGNLKKLWPTFNLDNKAAWCGNIFSWLGGAVKGQTMAFDAVYFYNRGTQAGVEAVEGEAADFVVTANTVNVMGANGIQLYNIAGQLVKATEGTTLGLDNLAKGVYVAKAANKTRKIVVK